MELFLTIIIGVVIVIFVIMQRRKNVDVTGVTLGPVNLEFLEKDVEVIDVLSTPIASCKGELITPVLKVKVMDENNQIIEGKKVKLEIYNESGLLSTRKISGALTKKSDMNGIVIFDDLVIKETGSFKIYIISDKKEVTIDEIDVFPPGLAIDFWNYKVGTSEYEERLDRILRFKSTGC